MPKGGGGVYQDCQKMIFLNYSKRIPKVSHTWGDLQEYIPLSVLPTFLVKYINWQN